LANVSQNYSKKQKWPCFFRHSVVL